LHALQTKNINRKRKRAIGFGFYLPAAESMVSGLFIKYDTPPKPLPAGRKNDKPKTNNSFSLFLLAYGKIPNSA
jgi:hypothetical protein